jgi:hypothetical protein
MIRGEGKPWAYDPEWITAQALQPPKLVKVLLDCGCTPPFGALPLPYWWFSVPPERQQARRFHALTSMQLSVMWCLSRAQRRDEYRCPHMLCVHQPTGQWMDHDRHETGMELLGLVQLRHGITQAKAAWRVSKLLGFPRPVPPA